MILFPAIDLLDNNVVRLLYGDRTQTTIYGDPIEIAKKWVDYGAEYLHIVDLNAAFGDNSVNENTLKMLFKEIDIPIQIGGGIRSMDKLKYYLDELGADRVIIGTAAIENPKFLEDACVSYGAKIACGIDAKNGKVAIKGWMDDSDITPYELAKRAKDNGVETIIYTDISRDGALSGVNVEETLRLQTETGLKVIASGGIKSLIDIKNLITNKIYGAILGKSIYTGNIDLRTAIEIVRGYDVD